MDLKHSDFSSPAGSARVGTASLLGLAHLKIFAFILA